MEDHILTKYGWTKTDARPIPGYPGYVVAKDGRVYGKHGRTLEHYRGKVKLYKDGKHERRLVAELILETFIGPCPAGCVVGYKYGPNNYNFDNIYWAATHGS